MKFFRAQTILALPLVMAVSACSSTTSVGELNYAIMNDDLQAVRAGIENGADVNGTNEKNYGATPMHTAALEGNVTIMRELLEAGGEVEKPDCAGQTPLMYAAGAGSLATSRLLVEKGANVNRLTGDANRSCPDRSSPEGSALSAAAKGNHPEVVRFLLDNGAKAGGKRALAFALLDESREPVAKQLRAAGYKADEETVRMVAEFSAAQKQQTTQASQTQTASNSNSNDNEYGVGDAAADAVVTGVLWTILGGF